MRLASSCRGMGFVVSHKAFFYEVENNSLHMIHEMDFSETNY